MDDKLDAPPRSKTAYRSIKCAGSDCSVCGKDATGVHYRSVSCNGCRSFFRRSIATNREYRCKRLGEDQRDCFLRHRCKNCRMSLCLASGMDPEAVRVEDEVEGLSDLPDDPEDMKPVLNPPLLESKLEKKMQTVLLLEDAHHQLRISTYLPQLSLELCMDDFAFCPSKLGSNFEVMCAQAYEPVAIQLYPEEMFIKHRIPIDFSQFDFTHRKLWMFQDQVYAIEFLKALPVFPLLDDSSKRVLLASALTCSNFTTGFFSYVNKSDRSCYPDGGVMTWSREMQDETPDSTRFHTALIAAMKEMQLDKREYTLLKMILVCNPLLSGLSPHDVTLLQHEKEQCTKTLLSYVLARHGVKEGPAIFAKILSVIDIATVLTSWQKSQHILIMAMGLQKMRSPLCEDIFHSH